MKNSCQQIVFIKGDTGQTTVAAVGGKGYSLIRMAQAGLPVPAGVVLTTGFFAPWVDAIQTSGAWTAFRDANPDVWSELCDEMKELCSELVFRPKQRETLEALRDQFPALKNGELLAVRSSSPQEDLLSASFAGGYETRLGVRWQALEQALRHCFASLFDERVFVYKREHGFDVLAPRIAAAVQQQIASDVAGVAFSLNPLTNDYDEAVIDANWGLGESVVAGLASPDHYVVDKVSHRLVQEKLGAKQVSIWRGEDGDRAHVKRCVNRLRRLSPSTPG